ncbi:MerR family transcriptional regulator [Streptosporangium carneum]|uniref:MerR family transcriptional regulator n=1 Tax=Streptosporangium carneum TaxID=47481 RepID=UPI0028525FB0|nr:MerR family transcriptional regulator [Streptosporangium carneum]
MSVYTPGQVVEETGFSLDTLRYYERIGLLERVGRNAAGQRRFTQADVGWLGLIRCLRDTGMPIAEMLRFAELVRAGDHTIPDRVALLEAHDRRVEGQVANLREKQRAIRNKVGHYRAVIDVPPCDDLVGSRGGGRSRAVPQADQKL